MFRILFVFVAFVCLKSFATCAVKITRPQLVDQVFHALNRVTNQLGSESTLDKSALELFLKDLPDEKLVLYQRYIDASIELRSISSHPAVPGSLRNVSPNLNHFYSTSISQALRNVDSLFKSSPIERRKEILDLRAKLETIRSSPRFDYVKYLRCMIHTFLLFDSRHLDEVRKNLRDKRQFDPENIEEVLPDWVTNWIRIPGTAGEHGFRLFHLRFVPENLNILPIFIFESLSEEDLILFRAIPFAYPIDVVSHPSFLEEKLVFGVLGRTFHQIDQAALQFSSDHNLSKKMQEPDIQRIFEGLKNTAAQLTFFRINIFDGTIDYAKNMREVHQHVVGLINEWSKEPDAETRENILKILYVFFQHPRAGLSKDFLKDFFAQAKNETEKRALFGEGLDEKSLSFLIRKLESFIRD